MLTPAEKILLTTALLATAAAFLAPLSLRFRMIRAAGPESRSGRILGRAARTLFQVLFQRCALKKERPVTGFVHLFIFYGALVFDTVTVNHVLEGYFAGFSLFGQTRFGALFSLLVDACAVLVLAGTLYLMVRRFIFRPRGTRTSPLDSGTIYFFLITVTLSYLYFKAFALAAHPGTAQLSFLGQRLADAVSEAGMASSLVLRHLKISWWLHLLLVFGFISYVPHSKYVHLIAGPLNILFRTDRPSGEIKALDLETAGLLGTEKASDYSWKDGLDAFACMECGRCQDVCPAFASGKPLSPKVIIGHLKSHLLRERRHILAKTRESLPPLLPDVMNDGEVWTCTTCGACRHVCPVEVEHIPKLVGIRQSQVLMDGRYPRELRSFFRNLEANFNPWGLGFAKRADWAEGLDVPLLRDRPRAEYLFWVGCAGAYDEEGIQTSRALVSILKRADVDFAVLGSEEKCCGDSARRLGNEHIYQTLARANLEMFKRYRTRKIITMCPHGYNTFRHEYPALINRLAGLTAEDEARLRAIEVIPHVSFIARLIREEKLRLRPGATPSIVYHDPCYLGRHNGLVREPRQILSWLSGGPVAELENNREHSFCCGAGGGLMWTEENLGKRINHLRADEVVRSGAKRAATACPFCLTMLRDGLKDRGQSEIPVRDLAQWVAESLSD